MKVTLLIATLSEDGRRVLSPRILWERVKDAGRGGFEGRLESTPQNVHLGEPPGCVDT